MRLQYRGYEDSLKDDLETYVLEDLNLDTGKVTAHMNSLTLDPSFYIPSKSGPWKFFQYYIHAKMFNETMNGYGRHDGLFAPYEAVIAHGNKIHRDLKVPLVFATARGNHLKNIDRNTKGFIDQFFPGVPHVELDNTSSFWVRTTSSADKPAYLHGVGAWVDDDYRNDVLRNYLREKNIFIIKRAMPLNAHLECHDIIYAPEDTYQPAMERLYDRIKTLKGTPSEIHKVGFDIDDTLRPFRYHMGDCVKLLRELEPELVESLQK